MLNISEDPKSFCRCQFTLLGIKTKFESQQHTSPHSASHQNSDIITDHVASEKLYCMLVRERECKWQIMS